jgi:hypothetical protein
VKTISTVEELVEFGKQNQTSYVELVGQVRSNVNGLFGLNSDAPVYARYEKLEHRDWGGDVIALTELYTVVVGLRGFDLDDILDNLGVTEDGAT